MAIDTEQVKQLLGSGLSNEVVATAVGCEPSYITQLMSDEQFAADVINLRAVTLTANTRRDRSIDGIEDKLLEKLQDAVEMNSFYKPRDILHAANIVNKMQRRGVPAHESLTVQNKIVQLIMPTQIIQQFVTNTQGEVIEVTTGEGSKQTLTTMPAQQLLRKLAQDAGDSGDGNKYRELQKFLPPSTIEGELAVAEVREQERQGTAVTGRYQREHLARQLSRSV